MNNLKMVKKCSVINTTMNHFFNCRKFWLFVQLIAFTNSAWNPFTYCVFSQDFRKGFKRIFFWRKEGSKKENVDRRLRQREPEVKNSNEESDTASRRTESEVL